MAPCTLKTMTQRQPVLFIGHGSPMNAIEDNRFTQSWKTLGHELQQRPPRLILMISAHWYIPASRVTVAERPRVIYDMHGFPEALYRLQYPAPGSPQDAIQLTERFQNPPIHGDYGDAEWGLDHGSWSVLTHLFPEAQIPVLQLSLDRRQRGDWHLQWGQQLSALREEGVLIIGSGNLVHNLRQIDFQRSGGYDWAESFEEQARQLIAQRQDQKLARFQDLGAAAQQSIPTPDHFLPLLYILGASDKNEAQHWLDLGCDLGSISMASVLIGG